MGLHQCAANACIALTLALGDLSAVAKPPSIDEDYPKVVIRCKEFFVAERYPKMPLVDWIMTKHRLRSSIQS